MTLREWAKNNESVVVVLASILTIGGFLFATLKLFFTIPTLALTLQTSDLRLPLSMYVELEKAVASDSNRLPDSTSHALREVRGFLRDTKTFTQIQLCNTSRVSLTNLDLRLRHVRHLDGWAVDADNLDIDEQIRLSAAVKYDASDELLTLHSIPRLPPKSTLTLFVWGDVASFAMFENQQLTVTYDGGAGELVTQRTIGGVDAFIYDNAGLLVITLLLLNVGAWGVYVDWKEKRRPVSKPQFDAPPPDPPALP